MYGDFVIDGMCIKSIYSHESIAYSMSTFGSYARLLADSDDRDLTRKWNMPDQSFGITIGKFGKLLLLQISNEFIASIIELWSHFPLPCGWNFKVHIFHQKVVLEMVFKVFWTHRAELNKIPHISKLDSYKNWQKTLHFFPQCRHKMKEDFLCVFWYTSKNCAALFRWKVLQLVIFLCQTGVILWDKGHFN